jgi:hypothetical protein
MNWTQISDFSYDFQKTLPNKYLNGGWPGKG